MKYEFVAWNWDGGEFVKIPTDNPVDAIHWAWNYEFDVYELIDNDEKFIFSGQLNNDDNSETLKKFGLRLIDHGKVRRLQNIETGEIYIPGWDKDDQ